MAFPSTLLGDASGRPLGDSTYDHPAHHQALEELLVGPAFRNVKGYGAQGDDSTDDTEAIQDCLDVGKGIIYFPIGTYRVSSTLRLSTGQQIIGQTGSDTLSTRIKWMTDDGSPVFDSDPLDYLAFFSMRDLKILSNYAAASTGDGDCFNLYGVTNNSNFTRVFVANFRGDAWNIARRTTGSDATASSNVIYDQCFVSRCGGYGFNVDGYSKSHWNMCDINSCVDGAFKFSNGVSNQAGILITNLWWEGGAASASRQPILLSAMDNQPICLVNPTFSGPSNGTDIIKIEGASGAHVNLINGQGFTYTNWVNDTVNNRTITFANRKTYISSSTGIGQLVIEDTSPLVDIYDIDGTSNLRRWRWQISGSNLQLDSRTDAQASSKVAWKVPHNTGVVEFPNGVLASGGSVEIDGALDHDGTTVGFYGTAPTTQQVLATGVGATVDNVITALQTLGLVKQS